MFTAEREAFEKQAEGLLTKPARMIDFCMEVFDAWRNAENRDAEHVRQILAWKELHDSEREAYEKTAEENGRLARAMSECMRKLEELTHSIQKLREKYGKAAEENARLKAANDEIRLEHERMKKDADDLSRQNVELVNACAQMQEKYDEAAAQNQELNRLALALQEQVGLGRREMYGASTERTGRIFNDEKMAADPLAEDAEDPGSNPNGTAGKKPKRPYSAKDALAFVNGKTPGDGETPESEESGDKKPRKKKVSPEERYAGLDQVNFYNYDLEELERKYGPDYRILRFERKWELRETRPKNYIYNIYTPVVEAVNPESGEREIMAQPHAPYLYPGSFVSESLFASISVRRFDLGLPVFRIEREYGSRGVPLSRQTMCNWIIHFAQVYFYPVVERMKEELRNGCTVQQIDETTWPVVIWPEEGKKNGSKGYIWIHTTSELCGGHKVVIYVFEQSRSAEHLRRFLKDLATYVVSDAYCAYFSVEKESGGLIRVSSCWMHMRRAFAKAVVVMEEELEEMTAEEIRDHPAVKGLLLCNEVFKADTPLKGLPPEVRKARREKEVAPQIDRFFEFIHGMDADGPAVTGKLREAVVYARNQEEHLKVFLEDGTIPMDNGQAERSVKPLAAARRSSLFSFSMDGAEANAILCSVIETAKANGADPYTYVKFLLREMTRHLCDSDFGFYDDLMPWSPMYRLFEEHEHRGRIDETMPESNEPPEGFRARRTRPPSEGSVA